MHSAALVTRDGSIDWLCWPRFDSDACFAALLGDERHGYWRIAPVAPALEIRRRYVPDTLVLETEMVTERGVLRIVDCMPPRGHAPDLVRVVTCLAGAVDVRMELAPRFGYGDRKPWIQRLADGIQLTSAPDNLTLWTPAPVRGDDGTLVAELALRAGETVDFVLAWHAAHADPPLRVEAASVIEQTITRWQAWSARCRYDGPWSALVRRSMITLKALTFTPTGGVVAAPTTSLPEQLGGVRNWDYRYCWLRDATLTLYALLAGGYRDEARAFSTWFARVARAEPSRLQVLYGVAGERRLTELELPWLPGHRGSRPVRIGNVGATQLQLDIYGELIDCLHHARAHGIEIDGGLWELQRGVLAHVGEVWPQPDEGIWEVRGPRRHFTYSKIMTWVAFDRMIKDARRFALPAPLAEWIATRDRIHAEICARGVDPERGVFTQAFGRRELDASLLLIPQVGFLPPSDVRVRRTIHAIARELSANGYIRRYDTERTDDGLPPGEGVFLPCSFWLADALAAIGEHDAAVALFERLLSATNDVGLLAEELDPGTGELLGNFPQAFSHVALVNTAMNLGEHRGAAHDRPRQ